MVRGKKVYPCGGAIIGGRKQKPSLPIMFLFLRGGLSEEEKRLEPGSIDISIPSEAYSTSRRRSG
jgi:hypothetical protein